MRTSALQRILLVFAAVLLTFLCSCETVNSETEDVGVVEIFVFDTGKADAILITTENHTVVIDTAERKHAQLIIDELLNRGITGIDTLIISHFHKDHLGGAADIIDNIDIHEIFIPNYGKDSKHFDRFSDALDNAGLETIILTDSISFSFDYADFVIYPSGQEYYLYSESDNDDNSEDSAPEENDFSLIVTMTHKDNTFIFTGDAKAGRLEEFVSSSEIVNYEYDFIKIPHHGRFGSFSEEFLMTVNPVYAVITCSDDNPPSSDVLSILNLSGTTVYLTTDGSIRCTSNGVDLIIEYAD